MRIDQYRLITGVFCLMVVLAGAAENLSALYPMDYYPHQESLAEVAAREARLFRRAADFDAQLASAIADGKIAQWVEDSAPKYNTSSLGKKSYSALDIATALLEITDLALRRKDLSLQSALAAQLARYQPIAVELYEQNRLQDLSEKQSGYPRDLNTVGPAQAVLEMAYALKLLGKYDGPVRERTESFIGTYVENHGPYTGKFLTTGYNKEIFAMNVASLVALLYAEDLARYPATKRTFEAFWDGIVNCSYETDNSPHYDASTGFWLILRMAILHHREDDLRKVDRFHDILTRMALTVANNGQTAKWGKSMEQLTGNELTPDGSAALSWCLKMGYRLFKDPFLLYTARKYEDLRLFGTNKAWQKDSVAIWPTGINFQEARGILCPSSTPLSTVTTRITSRTSHQGLLLGRGDTNVVAVQDKLILSTGRHPFAPYLLMDLSYTQHKASIDHRIGIDNYMFGAVNLCTYLGRPGEGSRMSRIFICPRQYPFPTVDAVSGDVYPSSEYTRLMGFNPALDYHLVGYSATNPLPGYAYGIVDYDKFQYDGVRAKREVVLTHNGVVLVMDRIRAGKNYTGQHSAGVIYQLWPGLKLQDSKHRWVVQSPHAGMAVSKDGVVKHEFSTLFYFPPVGTSTETAVRTDLRSPSAKISRTFSAQTKLNPNSEINIISLIIPLQDYSKAAELVKSISVTEEKGSCQVRIPCVPDEIQVLFPCQGVAQFGHPLSQSNAATRNRSE